MGWGLKDVPVLDGKVAVVTGANAGLGLATAKGLAGAGARVLLACRNAAKAEVAAAEIRAAAEGADVEVLPLDLASLQSVAEAADEVKSRTERLDLLVNNAGLMGVDHTTTADGFETQIGVNHLGHFALTAHLVPLLLAAEGSRVVTVSSMGHRAGRMRVDDLSFERRRYDRWQAYFQSKLANLLFALELHRRLAGAADGEPTTASLAAHPGGSHTDLGTEGSGLGNAIVRPAMALGQPAHLGALPALRAATDPTARSGEFYGPRLFLRGHPVRETPSRRARDPETAKALWTRSEELTGLTFAIP